MLDALFTYLKNNGTKTLGALVGVLGIIVNTSDIIPQAWLKYFILAIAVLTYLRGQSNTQAIASAVVQQHADAIATSVATGTPPILAPAGKLQGNTK